MQIAVRSPAASPARFLGRRLLLGLNGVTYYAGFTPFLNWWKSARRLEISRTAAPVIYGTDAEDAGYIDANGDLSATAPTDVDYITATFYTQPDDVRVNYTGEQFTVYWDGSPSAADVSSRGGTQSFDLVGKSGTFTFGSLAVEPNASIKFTVDPAKRNDPPRNIRIVQTRYLSDTVIDGISYPGFANGGIFNPHWLHEVRRFKTLRLMDWGCTNNSTVTDFSQIASLSRSRWCQPLGNVSEGSGSKGHIPLALIVALAQQTGCNIHYCFPHLATNAFVTSVADYFRDNFPANQVIQFEYSNECWNYSFGQTTYCDTQGVAVFGSGDAARGRKWYGYRAAEVMSLTRASFGAQRSRWSGILGTQTVLDAAPLDSALTGIAKWKTDNASSLTVSDLFDAIHCTGYFSTPNPASAAITAINREPNALVTTAAAHGWAIGQRVTFSFHPSDGMNELDFVTATITAVPNSTTFRIDVDTSSYTALAGTRQASFVVGGERFDLIKTSEDRFSAGLESTKYAYFMRQLAADCLATIPSMKRTWLALRNRARANGLKLEQYEGGSHVIGDGSNRLPNAYDTNAASQKYFDFVFNFWHAPETALVYFEVFRAFTEIGGEQPAKFVEGNTVTKWGGWGGFRWMPSAADPDGDFDNPVWKATKAANAANFLNRPALIANFTPAALFSSGEVGIWLDPQDLSTMKQETTGASATTAAAVGSPVGSMRSKVNGLWFTAPSAGACPILRQVAGFYYLEFDGVDDVLFVTQAPLYAAGAATAFIDFQGYSGNNQRSILMEGYSGDTAPLYILGRTDSTGSNMSLYMRSSTSERIGNGSFYGSAFPLTRRVMTVIDTGTEIIGYDSDELQGPSISYTRSGAMPLDRLAVGATVRQGGNSSFCRTDLYGLTAVGRVAAASEIASAQAYYAA